MHKNKKCDYNVALFYTGFTAKSLLKSLLKLSPEIKVQIR